MHFNVQMNMSTLLVASMILVAALVRLEMGSIHLGGIMAPIRTENVLSRRIIDGMVSAQPNLRWKAND